jgi:penicillin-binding protein 2
MAFIGNEEQTRELQDRFKYATLVLILGALILASRLAYLQILSGEQMRQYAEENRIKKVKIPAPRGMLLDRYRRPIVDNRPAFDVIATPQYLKESGRADEVLSRVASLLKVPVSDLKKKLSRAKGQASFLPVSLKENLTRDEVAELETWKLELPGISVEMAIQRTNLHGDVASHVLGYIGQVSPQELSKLNRGQTRKYNLDDVVGKSGLEKEFESDLRGVDGSELVEVDALGRSIQKRETSGRVLVQNREVPSIPGKNLILSIDQDLQDAAVRGFGDKTGGLIAIDPRNGEVLAMISRPSFDPTEFSRGIDSDIWRKLISDENKPLRDKAIQDHYMPGSTFKVITAIAGLEEGVIDENTTFNCTGSINLGNRVVHCHKKAGHGPVNVVKALTKSCDVFFYRLAQKLKSVNDIAKWAFHMGFGARTGIELAREATGLVPTEEWKQKRFGAPWSPGETLYVAIGQSFMLATTIQLANAYAALVNGGTLYRPHLLRAIESADGQILKEFPPQVLEKTSLQKKTIELVTQGLWGVVNDPGGTAHSQAIKGMEFAGKTGTVQVIQIRAEKIFAKCITLPYRNRHHGVFVGYAPIKNPSIAIAVVAEHACSGSMGAAPIAREVIKTYLQKYYPDLYSDSAIAERIRADQRTKNKSFEAPTPREVEE